MVPLFRGHVFAQQRGRPQRNRGPAASTAASGDSSPIRRTPRSRRGFRSGCLARRRASSSASCHTTGAGRRSAQSGGIAIGGNAGRLAGARIRPACARSESDRRPLPSRRPQGSRAHPGRSRVRCTNETNRPHSAPDPFRQTNLAGYAARTPPRRWDCLDTGLVETAPSPQRPAQPSCMETLVHGTARPDTPRLSAIRSLSSPAESLAAQSPGHAPRRSPISRPKSLDPMQAPRVSGEMARMSPKSTRTNAS